MTETAQAEALALRPGEGEARWWFGELATIKLTAAQTGGHFTLLKVVAPAALEVPLHVHDREDETFWVLEGSASFQVGDETIEAGPGTVLFAPRDGPHRYVIGPEQAKILFHLSPGGFEAFVRKSSEPAAAPTLPPPAEEPPDMERLLPIVRTHGLDILEP